MTQWYCRLMGDELGPFTGAQLHEMALSHRLSPEDYVRKGLDGNWVGAYRVMGLFDPQSSTSGISLMNAASSHVVPQVAQHQHEPVEEWFCISNHEKLGPMPFEALQSLVGAGRLLPTDRVWNTLIPKHRAASEIKSLGFRAAAS